jgi:hypothetical protein
MLLCLGTMFQYRQLGYLFENIHVAQVGGLTSHRLLPRGRWIVG